MRKTTISAALVLCALALMLFCSSGIASANEIIEQGSCGADVTFSLGSDGELEITGHGAMDDYSDVSATPWYAFIGEITSVSVGEGVTSIGDFAFGKLSALVSAELSPGVERIGVRSFWYCDNLTGITLPSSVTEVGQYAFALCGKLTDIDLNEGLLTLGDSSFASCSSLTRIDLPSTLRSIGNFAFSRCSKLTELNLPDALFQLGSCCASRCDALQRITVSEGNRFFSYDETGVLFNYDKTALILYPCACEATEYEVPASVLSIDSYAFYCCEGLQSIDLPSGLRTIGENAFDNCSSLQSVTLPDSLTTVSRCAFDSCSGLTELKLSSGMAVIPISCFSGCKSLEDVTIPAGITSVSSSAFLGCKKLRSVHLPDTLVSIGSSAFGQCNSLEEINIPDSVLSIGSSAFSKLSPFMAISSACWKNGVFRTGSCILSSDETISPNYTVDSSVLCIAGDAFKGNAALCEIVIPGSVEIIPEKAFYGCSNLSKVTLSEGTKTIGASAFRGCAVLAEISLPSGISSVGANAFDDTAFYSDADNLDNGILYADSVLICAEKELTGSCNIKDGTACIAANAFDLCKSITSITLPDSVLYIGDSAFSRCEELISIRLSANLTEISSGAFSGCEKLSSIKLPASVSRIGGNAFRRCTGLEELIIPDRVEYIGVYAFEDCIGLTSINVPGSVKTIDSWAFCDCSSLNRAVFNEGVEELGDNLFANCVNLRTVILPGSIEVIGENAFTASSPDLDVFFSGDSGSWGESAYRIGVGSDNLHLNYTYTPQITFEYDNGVLILSGGDIPDGVSGGEFDWTGAAQDCRALMLDSDTGYVGNYAFEDYTDLESIVFYAPHTDIAPYAFSKSPKLESVVSFGELDMPQDLSGVSVFVPEQCADDNRIIGFSLEDGVLTLKGDMVLDAYTLLDTVAVIGNHLGDISVIKVSSLQLMNVPLYYLEDEKRTPLEDNTLTNGELYVYISDENGGDKPVTFNELCSGIEDGSISHFTLLTYSAEHGQNIETPVTVRDSEFANVIKRVLNAIVTLLNRLFRFLSALNKK